MAHSTNWPCCPPAHGNRSTACVSVLAALWVLLLCVVTPWMAACEHWHPDYRNRPFYIGRVWAVNGDRFYVATGTAIVLWENGDPTQVLYSPPERYGDYRDEQIANAPERSVYDLWGADGELRAAVVGGKVLLAEGSSWRMVPEIHGARDVWGHKDDLWVSTKPGGEVQIYRLHNGAWSLDAEIEGFTVIRRIRGDPDRGLWAAGYRFQPLTDPPGTAIAPVLLRRGVDGWQTVDSTHFGQAQLCIPADTCDAVGDVQTVSDMWVDLQGRAHLVHDGPGILVHNGTESWMEESPVTEPYRFVKVDMSPDGTVYALASDLFHEHVDSAYLWIHDSTGWHGVELWSKTTEDIMPDTTVCGLSAFDGGAIVTTCVEWWSTCVSGDVLRIWPDGTWRKLRHFDFNQAYP